VFFVLTAVTWLAAREAILFIAPIALYTMAGCAMLAAAVATLAFVVERSEWLATKRTEARRDRALARNEARQSDIASDRAQMHLMAEGRLMAATVRQVENGLIHPAALGDGKFSSFPAQVINQIEAQSAAPLGEQRQPLLPALVNCPNILIVGGKGRGKTQLLKWIECERLNRGNVVTVLDSHAQPASWGGQVIGAGRKYESIAAAMIDLNTMLDNRYNQFSTGKDDFTIIDTFVDEFTLLPKKLKSIGYEIQDYSFSALTEGRKVGMNCVWGSHSDRAEALGLKGATDLKECFDAIVYLKKVKGDYYAMVNFGEGIEETKYNHPGPFTIARPTSKVKILSLPTPGETAKNKPESIAVSNWPKAKPDLDPDAPTSDEMAAIEAFVSVRDSGKFSWRKATQAAYGPGKFGDGPNQNLRATLDKFGIDYSEYIK
jgi:hypothetical protein